jgi:DNA-binding NarL/FixJ family response regulator
MLASVQGQHERAIGLSGAAAALRQQAGMPMPRAAQPHIEQQLEASRRALGRLAAAVLASGHQLSPAEAIAQTRATRPNPDTDRSTAGSDPLSPRERQVTILVGHGRTNRQIATDLIISEGTVATHVQHILTKLRLQSRAQIAAWAAQHQLLDEPNSPPGDDHAPVPR